MSKESYQFQGICMRLEGQVESCALGWWMRCGSTRGDGRSQHETQQGLHDNLHSTL